MQVVDADTDLCRYLQGLAGSVHALAHVIAERREVVKLTGYQQPPHVLLKLYIGAAGIFMNSAATEGEPCTVYPSLDPQSIFGHIPVISQVFPDLYLLALLKFQLPRVFGVRASCVLADGPTKELGFLRLAFDVLQAGISDKLNRRCGLECLRRMHCVLIKVDDEWCLVRIVMLLDKRERLCNGSMRIKSDKLQCVKLR